MTPEINLYLEKRYQGLMDYAIFHSSRAGIPEEAADVLDEVLLSLLQMDEQKLLNMLSSKKCHYTELDFFILRMIKLNCYSETAPYRAKCKPIPSSEVDFRRLNIEDNVYSDVDIPDRILKQFEQVREAFESLNLSPKAKRIFEFKFFQDQSFSDWPGNETKKQLYETYSQVVNLIQAKIFKKTLL
jgi:hypothetical protein